MNEFIINKEEFEVFLGLLLCEFIRKIEVFLFKEV